MQNLANGTQGRLGSLPILAATAVATLALAACKVESTPNGEGGKTVTVSVDTPSKEQVKEGAAKVAAATSETLTTIERGAKNVVNMTSTTKVKIVNEP